ncbi:MAG: VWA domain-containing protein, partial [Myxococcales bacterium]|nr:VWA domain-containing protein [Myxococcales bacterium]
GQQGQGQQGQGQQGQGQQGQGQQGPQAAADPNAPSLDIPDHRLRLRQGFPDIPTIGAWLEVRDLDGVAIAGLTANQFRASVDDTPIEVRAAAPMSSAKADTAYILLVDRSKSMQTNKVFDTAIQLGKTLIDRLGKGDTMAVASFGDDYALEHTQFTGDAAALGAALDGIVADDSETHLYDALAKLLVLLEGTGKDPEFPRKKVVLVVSDGVDDGSSKTLADVTQLFERIQVPLFTVGFPTRKQPAFPEMAKLSEESGGRHLASSDPDEIGTAFTDFVKELDGGYLLELHCEHCQPTGKRKELAVTLGVKGAFEGNVLQVEMFQTPETRDRLAQQAKAPAEPAPEPAGLLERFGLPIAGAALLLLLLLVFALRGRRKPADAQPAAPAPSPSPQTAATPPAAGPGLTAATRKVDDPAPAPAAAPGPHKTLRLETVAGGGRLQPSGPYKVSAKGLTLGRDGDIQQLADDSVSGRHCRFRLEGSILVVEDLQSTNGTVRNEYRIDAPERLESGDELTVGATTFRVMLED